jgi:hypothetical protein
MIIAGYLMINEPMIMLFSEHRILDYAHKEWRRVAEKPTKGRGLRKIRKKEIDSEHEEKIGQINNDSTAKKKVRRKERYPF